MCRSLTNVSLHKAGLKTTLLQSQCTPLQVTLSFLKTIRTLAISAHGPCGRTEAGLRAAGDSKPVAFRRPCILNAFTRPYPQCSRIESTQVSFPSSFSVHLSCFQIVSCCYYAPAYNDDIRTSLANNFLWAVVLLAKTIPCKNMKDTVNIKIKNPVTCFLKATTLNKNMPSLSIPILYCSWVKAEAGEVH